MVEQSSEINHDNLNIYTPLQNKSLKINDRTFQFILEQFFNGKESDLRKWLFNVNKIEYEFGTKEWADGNFNTHYACKHGCWYCYAWSEAYQRQRDYWMDWGRRMTKRNYWNKGWRERKDGFIIMYPTTHDILPEIMDDCFVAIRKMLEANINVLLVSKPHLEVIKGLIENFSGFKKGQPKLILRFSISTNDDEILAFWEPNAPKFEERFKSLKIAYQNGYHTSVSMEPFFPPKLYSQQKDIGKYIELVMKLKKYVKGTLWIGMMNHIPVNIQRGKILTKKENNKIQSLKNFYSIINIKQIISNLYKFEKIRWKESIKKFFIKKILEVS